METPKNNVSVMAIRFIFIVMHSKNNTLVSNCKKHSGCFTLKRRGVAKIKILNKWSVYPVMAMK